eukprot:CAMPEP_0114409828 /NCGR_PEP_ID=MMETSP0102-20121206/23645_1 /TAXON_ID=38822 ORGANISM="Pteridomonas danica, Strain PT" /NCGR_SAMPLE_ID=MMETSP0102 /ASSEMBLY_ACC=CAM_ASM_000212 /LENGTH=388 /DNA_ID=CAMNT_0001577311 /DNA_START=256 /DNA_END=1420 /DNA_ORIENTATION=+
MGASNVALPVLTRAGMSVVSDPQLETPKTETIRTPKLDGEKDSLLASPVKPFASLASWDSDFVLVPPQQKKSYSLQPRASLSGKVVRESLSLVPSRESSSLVETASRSTEGRLLKETLEVNYLHLGLTPWEALQREMGTFLESNGHQRNDTLDMNSLRNDLALRRQLKESYQDRSDGETSGVFELTTVVDGDEKTVDRSGIGSLDGEGAQQLDMMEHMLREGVLEEKSNEMRVKKASVRPWRTLPGKPQLIVEDGMFATQNPHWYGPQPYQPTMPNDLHVAKPPIPVHQLGITSAVSANVLAGGRRRVVSKSRPRIPEGLVVQGYRDLGPKPFDNIKESPPQKPTLINKEKLIEDSPADVKVKVPRLVSIIRQKNEVLWKKKTGKQVL